MGPTGEIALVEHVVGWTNEKAEHSIVRLRMPHDLLATDYRVMGIDTALSFPDYADRSVPILSEEEAIRGRF